MQCEAFPPPFSLPLFTTYLHIERRTKGRRKETFRKRKKTRAMTMTTEKFRKVFIARWRGKERKMYFVFGVSRASWGKLPLIEKKCDIEYVFKGKNIYFQLPTAGRTFSFPALIPNFVFHERVPLAVSHFHFKDFQIADLCFHYFTEISGEFYFWLSFNRQTQLNDPIPLILQSF